MQLSDWDYQMNTNLKGTFLMCKYTISYMLKHGSGAIINMSSANGFSSTGGGGTYNATKAGIIARAKALAVDYSPTLRIVADATGSIDTTAQRKSMVEVHGDDEEALKQAFEVRAKLHPIGRIGKTDEIASVVGFLCSHEASFIDGSMVLVEGGLPAKNPAGQPR